MGVSPEEQALAASGLVEGLQADAPIGFAVHDEQLRFELVSHSLAAINGRPPAEHIGRRVADVLPPELAGQVEALLAEVRDSGVARIGIEMDGMTHAGQQARTYLAGFYPMTHGERRLVGVVVVDVTDRRRAQDALKESEAELSGAQRMAGVGWWTWTAGPDAAVYAPELLDLLGHDPVHGGRPQSVSKLRVGSGELDAMREAAMESLATGRPFARRFQVHDVDGHLRVLDARGDVVYDDAGRAVGLQGFSQDVTELARAEQRQRVIAELGQRALEERDLDALLRHAVDAVGREVGVDGVGVLEVLPGGERARVRAISRREPLQGEVVIPIESGGVIDRALTHREPVVSSDLEADPELEISPLERQAGVRSVALVVIDGQTRPFGVLGAMSERPDHFGVEDTAFLTAISNVLADAVERHAAEAAIAEISAARGRLVAQAIDAEDRARRSISEALHDGALQELLAARNELFAMAGRGGDDAAIAAAQERLTGIVVHLRDVMSAMHPTMLQYGGLEAALLAVVEQERGAGDFTAHVDVGPGAAGLRDELRALARPRAARQLGPPRGRGSRRRHRGARAGRARPRRRRRRGRLRRRAAGAGAGGGRDRDRVVPRARRGARRRPRRALHPGRRDARRGADSARCGSTGPGGLGISCLHESPDRA